MIDCLAINERKSARQSGDMADAEDLNSTGAAPEVRAASVNRLKMDFNNRRISN